MRTSDLRPTAGNKAATRPAPALTRGLVQRQTTSTYQTRHLLLLILQQATQLLLLIMRRSAAVLLFRLNLRSADAAIHTGGMMRGAR